MSSCLKRVALLALLSNGLTLHAQGMGMPGPKVVVDQALEPGAFVLFDQAMATPIYVAHEDKSPVKMAALAFREDVGRVSGLRPVIHESAEVPHDRRIILIGTIGNSPLLDRLTKERHIDTASIEGKWESALVTIIDKPFPGVDSALVIAGSDARGAAYALFDLSHAIGVSPWNWWADVPVLHHMSAAVTQQTYVQKSPAVPYRGIFLNDEDWGLRPWASSKMDPEIKNIGPHTYVRIFELLMRLHANTLWPAMHPGSTPFHSIRENTLLAAQWGIVMGSSHSEAMLRNNVGEWDVKRDGPWNYQLNRKAIREYWDARLKANAAFDNFYTVGMRGVHDSGLEATGSVDVKARLVEQVMDDQRQILSQRVSADLKKVPQVIWLYKESINLYRAGMKVPDDVTLGWTDDNYGYIRQMPTAREQARSGGSALYYHVSYWGDPHDYLWLCSTPVSLMREELTKAWDHGVRKLWILNVGDLKPAEADIEYFLRLAWQEDELKDVTEREYLEAWFSQQFKDKAAATLMAELMEQYDHLNFVRRPEFMGFNGYHEDIHRTGFNPLAWGDQNQLRLDAWSTLSRRAESLAAKLPPEDRDAYFELVGYPIEAAAAQNAKLLWNDRSFLDASRHDLQAENKDAQEVKGAYDKVQTLTAEYNSLAHGKWAGIMSSNPRSHPVFEMPVTATQSTSTNALPTAWADAPVSPLPPASGDDFHEQNGTVSIDAMHFSGRHDTPEGHWERWPDLGLSSGSVAIEHPGTASPARWIQTGHTDSMSIASSPWIAFRFSTQTRGKATALVYLLPTFPIDSEHRLRFGLSIDGDPPLPHDASGTEGHKAADITDWASNVLRNAEIQSIPLGDLGPGNHTIRLFYGDPGVVFEHITITLPGATPAYPFPPETR